MLAIDAEGLIRSKIEGAIKLLFLGHDLHPAHVLIEAASSALAEIGPPQARPVVVRWSEEVCGAVWISDAPPTCEDRTRSSAGERRCACCLARRICRETALFNNAFGRTSVTMNQYLAMYLAWRPEEIETPLEPSVKGAVDEIGLQRKPTDVFLDFGVRFWRYAEEKDANTAGAA